MLSVQVCSISFRYFEIIIYLRVQMRAPHQFLSISVFFIVFTHLVGFPAISFVLFLSPQLKGGLPNKPWLVKFHIYAAQMCMCRIVYTNKYTPEYRHKRIDKMPHHKICTI